MHVLAQIGFVSLGGIVGSLLRWGVSIAFARLFGTDFPWGTFFINLTGSLFLGWFMSMKERFVATSWIDSSQLTLMVAVGFTGAYTTFSTYEYETYTRLTQDETLKALIYLVGSMFLGLVAVYVGANLARPR